MVGRVLACKINWGMLRKYKRPNLHLPRSWPMDRLWHGAIQIGVATARRYRISWEMSNIYRWQVLHLPQSWQMDHLFCGAKGSWAAAAQCHGVSQEWSSEWSSFRPQPQMVHLLQSWKMDLPLHGAIHVQMVTALLSKISWGMYRGFNQRWRPSLPGWWISCYLGQWGIRRWQLWSPTSAAERAWHSSHREGICCYSTIAQGSIVLWGDPPRSSGADISEVLAQLNVQEFALTDCAFAAILDRSVVRFGNPACGGDSSEVQGLFAGL